MLGEGAFREGTGRDREGAERDVSEKGVYCLTRLIGPTCPNPLTTNNSFYNSFPYNYFVVRKRLFNFVVMMRNTHLS